MVASKLGFGVVIGRSDNDTSRRQAFVTMTCERSEKYVPKIRKLKHYVTGSRKCECLSKLRGYCRVNNMWRFNVISSIHNHVLDTKLQGHPIVCWLKPEEKEIILEISIIKVMPRNILVDLKWKRPQSVSDIRKIYNEHYQQNMANRGTRSKMQQLLKLLGNNQYVLMYKMCEDKFSVRDIFWFHPESIKLFNTFPTVPIIDSTYKTNKYRLPLLEIGVTSTEKTFFVGFAFLKYEKEDNVIWALEKTLFW
ncbi:protein FAR1-RELATED SEQUENCE 5-like [Vicia villosa]|uniref:protein FAR1-RELATED SEQUENCE 5-like n=1 Tax=Vicia villosa TaxID=3911 RepID=UPI00273CC07C|nr:protein FAR1-RELATED SEQUENCE 5-like [Vicia villosa]